MAEAQVALSGDVADTDEVVLAVVRAVSSLHPGKHDGLVFDRPGASAEVAREVDQYPGVRASMNVTLASARVQFHVDVNMGDPIWPALNQVETPRLLGGERLQLLGYPLHMVHAEEIVTAVQHDTVNTRWRDFADVWALSRRHPVDGDLQRNAITRVSAYRKAGISRCRHPLDVPAQRLPRAQPRLDAGPVAKPASSPCRPTGRSRGPLETMPRRPPPVILTSNHTYDGPTTLTVAAAPTFEQIVMASELYRTSWPRNTCVFSCVRGCTPLL